MQQLGCLRERSTSRRAWITLCTLSTNPSSKMCRMELSPHLLFGHAWPLPESSPIINHLWIRSNKSANTKRYSQHIITTKKHSHPQWCSEGYASLNILIAMSRRQQITFPNPHSISLGIYRIPCPLCWGYCLLPCPILIVFIRKHIP